MDIDLKEAVELAKNHEEIKKNLEEEDYFINSIIVMYSPKKNELDRWIVTFYSPSKNEVIQGVVKGKDNIEFKESEEPMNPTKKELEMDLVEFDSEEALEIAEEAASVPEGKLVQILATLKQEDSPSWDINLITSSLELHRVFIDAENGEVNKKEVKSLVRSEDGMPFIS